MKWIKSALTWLGGALALIAAYFYATKATRMEKRAQDAQDRHRDAIGEALDDDFADADKHRQRHEAAQKRAREAKDKARRATEHAANTDNSLDDLLDEYRRRLRDGS